MTLFDRTADRFLAWAKHWQRQHQDRIAAKPVSWHRGVVILMDAMGYKGIWQRARHPELIVKKLQRMQGDLTFYENRFLGTGLRGRLKFLGLPRSINPIVRGVSDSTLILVRLTNSNPMAERMQLTAALIIAQRAYLMGAQLEPRWATRGAIAVGDFLAEKAGPFIVGPAVDEAAAAMEASAGAFVVATPSAVEPLERLSRRTDSDAAHADWMASLQTVPWRVPLRDGHELDTRVLNPLAFGEMFRRHEIVPDVLGCFSDEPKVARYRDATAAFFAHMDRTIVEGLAKHWPQRS